MRPVAAPGALSFCEAPAWSGAPARGRHCADDRERGAEVVTLDTNLRSPLSVRFYENRMGYQRHGVIFRKEL